MGKIKAFLEMVRSSRLLAPNLRTMTLEVYTGRAHGGNRVARELVRDHLLALRWMNPNAVVYLRETRGQGEPRVLYTLWSGEEKSLKVFPHETCDDLAARILMAARDPAADAESRGDVKTDSSAARGSATVAPAAAVATSAAATHTHTQAPLA